MGARRDDISVKDRVQIVAQLLNPERAVGTVTQLAQAHGLSRQSIYAIAAKGQQVLAEHLKPAGHGPQAATKMIRVDLNRLRRSTLVLTEAGVSQREIELCLAEILDTPLTAGWVNGQLAQLEAAAQEVNQHWRPVVQEILAGDELYANGQPNLLLVGTDTLYIYALSRQPDCDGQTWGCLLLEVAAQGLLASDAGTGLALGAKLAKLASHQLDWDHLLRPLWGQVARLEQQAYAALAQVEERAALFEQATTATRLAQHLAKWEQLTQIAEEKIARYDAFYQLGRQIDAWFALIDLTTGQLQDVPTGIAQLTALGQQLQGWTGRIYHKLRTNLQNWPAQLFSYQPFLAQALQPLQAQYGQAGIAALGQLWQLEANHKRRPLSRLEQDHLQTQWAQALDQAAACLGEHLWSAWAAVSQVLGRTWRGSMLAECVNSLLRPRLDGRKHTDQGCLDLFCFLHNVRPFQRGKRAGASPAQLVGLDLPDDPLTLLGLEPKVSI